MFIFVFLFPLLLDGQSNTISMLSMLPSINTWENDELGRWSVDGKTLLLPVVARGVLVFMQPNSKPKEN
jgi:hypothetical protein